MKKFTVDHEWIDLSDDIGTVGITEYAQDALGDIVFIDLPQVGQQVQAGEDAAVIESVKAAGEVKSPVSGEIIEINEALVDKPNLINSAPEGDGWIYRLRLSDPNELDGLMDDEAYKKHINH